MTANSAAQQRHDTHVDVVVQDRNQAYSTSHRGVRASSTNSAMAAAERLAEKLFGPGAQVAKLPAVEGDPTTITRWHLSAAPAPMPMAVKNHGVTNDDGDLLLGERGDGSPIWDDPNDPLPLRRVAHFTEAEARRKAWDLAAAGYGPTGIAQLHHGGIERRGASASGTKGGA